MLLYIYRIICVLLTNVEWLLIEVQHKQLLKEILCLINTKRFVIKNITFIASKIDERKSYFRYLTKISLIESKLNLLLYFHPSTVLLNKFLEQIFTLLIKIMTISSNYVVCLFIQSEFRCNLFFKFIE